MHGDCERAVSTPPVVLRGCFAEEAERGVRNMLANIGVNTDSPDVIDTPKRVVKAMQEMTSGYEVKIDKLLAVGFDGDKYDAIIALRDIAFVSMCEHHMLPFIGTAGVAYIPQADADGKYRVVGISKLARLVDAYARRLQLQERMTTQISDALETHLKPRGVAVIVEAHHSCMSCRGVRKSGSTMATSVLTGLFKKDIAARAEVLAMIRGPR